jgi:hypothetical protein
LAIFGGKKKFCDFLSHNQVHCVIIAYRDLGKKIMGHPVVRAEDPINFNGGTVL